MRHMQAVVEGFTYNQQLYNLHRSMQLVTITHVQWNLS